MAAAVIFFNCSRIKEKGLIQNELDEIKSETKRQLDSLIAWQKQPWVKAKETSIDSLDIRIEDLSNPLLRLTFNQEGDSLFILSEEEFNMAKDIVKKYFDAIDTSIDTEVIDGKQKPFPYNYYFKLFIGHIDTKSKDKRKQVFVNLFTSAQVPHGWVKELKDIWKKDSDAGKYSGYMIIDLNNKNVESFVLSAVL